MKYCTSCGTETKKDKKFCTKCGKSFDETQVASSHAKSAMTTAIIVFVVIIFAVLILKKPSVNEQTAPLGPTEFIETVKQITAPEEQMPAVEKRREGYTLGEKPFAAGNYDYDERTTDFRLVCTHPCPVSKTILDQEFAAIEYAVRTLRGLTQSDITPSLLPFEVHASEDIACKFNPAWGAYKTVFTDSAGYTRGLLCFFYDKINYDRTKFPYSTSIHEVTHLFQENKIPRGPGVKEGGFKGGSVIWEGLSVMLDSFFLRGSDNSFCGQRNVVFKQAPIDVNNPYSLGGKLFFELCEQYGFDYDKLPALYRELDSRNGETSTQEFVQIINGIVGADTSALFKNAGVI